MCHAVFFTFHLGTWNIHHSLFIGGKNTSSLPVDTDVRCTRYVLDIIEQKGLSPTNLNPFSISFPTPFPIEIETFPFYNPLLAYTTSLGFPVLGSSP